MVYENFRSLKKVPFSFVRETIKFSFEDFGDVFTKSLSNIKVFYFPRVHYKIIECISFNLTVLPITAISFKIFSKLLNNTS